MFWCKKANTSCTLVSENKDANLLRTETTSSCTCISTHTHSHTHACQMRAHQTHACQTHACQVHARQTPTRRTHTYTRTHTHSHMHAPTHAHTPTNWSMHAPTPRYAAWALAARILQPLCTLSVHTRNARTYKLTHAATHERIHRLTHMHAHTCTLITALVLRNLCSYTFQALLHKQDYAFGN